MEDPADNPRSEIAERDWKIQSIRCGAFVPYSPSVVQVPSKEHTAVNVGPYNSGDLAFPYIQSGQRSRAGDVV